jgi:hypothetical protein
LCLPRLNCYSRVRLFFNLKTEQLYLKSSGLHGMQSSLLGWNLEHPCLTHLNSSLNLTSLSIKELKKPRLVTIANKIQNYCLSANKVCLVFLFHIFLLFSIATLLPQEKDGCFNAVITKIYYTCTSWKEVDIEYGCNSQLALFPAHCSPFPTKHSTLGNIWTPFAWTNRSLSWRRTSVQTQK